MPYQNQRTQMTYLRRKIRTLEAELADAKAELADLQSDDSNAEDHIRKTWGWMVTPHARKNLIVLYQQNIRTVDQVVSWLEGGQLFEGMTPHAKTVLLKLHKHYRVYL